MKLLSKAVLLSMALLCPIFTTANVEVPYDSPTIQATKMLNIVDVSMDLREMTVDATTSSVTTLSIKNSQNEELYYVVLELTPYEHIIDLSSYPTGDYTLTASTNEGYQVYSFTLE